MSPDTANTDPVVLLVSDLNDADVGGCLDRLRHAGIPVERSHSVYAAAADLAFGRNIRHILLDIRSLDDKEMAFHRLIKRSFPDASVIVPVFRGTGERAATYGPGIRPTPLDSLAEELCEEYGITAPSEILPPEPQAPDEDNQVVEEAPPPEIAEPLASDDRGFDESALAYEDDIVAAEETEETAFEMPEEPDLVDDSIAPPVEQDFEESEPIASPPTFDDEVGPQPTEPIKTTEDIPANTFAPDDEAPDAYRTIRDKLAGELRSAAQRTPPRMPPGLAAREVSPPSPQPERPASMLSPEEMDALMTNQEDEQRNQNDQGDGA